MHAPPSIRRPALWFALALLALAGCGDGERRDHEWRQPHTPSNHELVDPGNDGWSECPDLMTASGSRALVFFCGAGLIGMLAWSWLRARGYHHQAVSEESIDPVAPLRAGPYVLIGTVEGEDAVCPVAVRIVQRGIESHNKHGYHHRWVEQQRQIDVRAFVVRRDDGVRVTVEPGARVVLHDTLSRFEPSDGHSEKPMRTRIAEVRPGERIYVAGRLTDVNVEGGGGVYREAPRLPRLVPGGSAPMILSTEAPGGTARRLRRLHRVWAIGLAAALGFQLSVVAGPYLLDAVAGDVTTAEIQQVRTYETYTKPKNRPGYWTTHEEAAVTWAPSQRAVVRIADDLFGCAARDGCTQVVLRTASLGGFSTTQLGSQPKLTIDRGLLLFFISLGLLIAWISTLRVARPWWARKKVVDHGSGRLSMATSSVKDAVLPKS